MGKQNTITKDYMSVPEHFADCFNYYLFDAVRLLNACTNSNIEVNKGGEKVDVCSGLKALLEHKMDDGRRQGIMLTKKVYQLHHSGKTNDDIAKECDISLSQVKEILE